MTMDMCSQRHREDRTGFTDIDINELIDKLISFNDKFNMPTDHSITKKDVINALNELRDQNNIWKREGSDTFFSKSSTILHTYFSNTPIITKGYFKLAFEVDEKSSTILYTYVSNTPIITSGYFKLEFEIDEKHKIKSLDLEFLSRRKKGCHRHTIFSLFYESEFLEYVGYNH